MNNNNFVDMILEAIVPIAIISIILLLFIFFIRILFYLIIFILSKFYIKNRKKNKPIKPRSEIALPKAEDERFRDKENEAKKEREEFVLEGVQRMNEDFENKMQSISLEDDSKIVGIAKPLGFWTSLVLGDQLSQIIGRAQAINDKSHKGFWVSMLEAQARGLGRQHGLWR